MKAIKLFWRRISGREAADYDRDIKDLRANNDHAWHQVRMCEAAIAERDRRMYHLERGNSEQIAAVKKAHAITKGLLTKAKAKSASTRDLAARLKVREAELHDCRIRLASANSALESARNHVKDEHNRFAERLRAAPPQVRNYVLDNGRWPS
jgi:chromosome segregation ATPase